MNALLITHSRLLAEHILDALASAGYTLDITADLATAQRRLTGHPRYEIVLVAEDGGAEICSKILYNKSAEPGGGPRLLLLSPNAEDAEAAHNAGARFVHIPFTAGQLLSTLQVALRPQKLILLCDDSALIRKHTAPILIDAGYAVIEAEDGKEGLEQVRRQRPDLVLTDVEMPHMDGYRLCRTIKAERPELPVVMCSSLGEAQDVERGFDSGADDYLVKPAQPEELVSRIRLLLSIGEGLPTRERLLVVDDSPAIRHMIAESLRRQGFSVLSAQDGLAGLHAARRELPAMIITDYDMPNMTGFEMVHALKQDERTRGIPVMMLTARNTRRDQAQMRAIGLTTYLVKPFAVDKCVALVERVLAEKRLRDYKTASQVYISGAAMRAAEHAVQTGDLFAVRASEQVAAILFSDISGFTTLAAQRSPREIVDVLNACFDALCPIIREEGGDIDKFIGDAIMAIFEDKRDDGRCGSLRAVRAALRMQETLVRWRKDTGQDLHMRIGINTGVVVRGDIGSRHVRRDYTVIGDVVNRAQRLEASAPIDGVLIGQRTYDEAAAWVRCEPRPGIKLKGVEQPVTAYLAKELIEDIGAGAAP